MDTPSERNTIKTVKTTNEKSDRMKEALILSPGGGGGASTTMYQTISFSKP